MGNCASSAFVPWAGRNEVTLAAKTRKRAAKEALAAYKAYAGAHVAYLESMKIVGNSLVLFLEEEDKGLYSVEPPPPPPPPEQPSDYRTSWSQVPGALSDTATSHATSYSGTEHAPETPPENATKSIYSENVPSSEAAETLKPQIKEEAATQTAAGPPAWQNAGSQPQGLQVMQVSPANAVMPGLEPPRGAGLAQVIVALNGLFAEASEAVRPLTDLLTVGAAKNFAAPPALPPHVQGQYGAGAQYGQQSRPSEKLWEVLEILVVYERFRSRDIKAMEKTKWDYERQSGKLGKHSRKQVTAEKAAKQQKKINAASQKVQGLQGTISRLGQSVESLTHSIDSIKGQMVYPTLLALLPRLVEAWWRLGTIHDRQAMLLREFLQRSNLQNKLAGGSSVLRTHAGHHTDTQNLQNVLIKWDQAFTTNMEAQRKVFTSMIAWINKVDPSGANSARLGPGYSMPQNPIPAPYYGAAPSFNASYTTPQSSNNMPRVTHPPDTPPDQMMPYTAAGGAAQPVGPAPSQEVINEFLGGQGSGGEPLLALCNDWLRAMDRLPEKAVKDAIFAYVGWVKDAYVKQTAENKQAKKVEDVRKHVDKAEQKYEGLLKKERDFRATLANPQGTPMSRSLTNSTKAYQITSPYAEQKSASFPPSWVASPPVSEGGPPLAPSVSRVPPPYQGAPPAAPPPPGETTTLSLWQSPSTEVPPSTERHEEGLDKAGAKAVAKEQAKEVKAYSIAKEVDLALGSLEGLRQKLKEEQASLDVMALEARKAAITGVEQGFPNVFSALTNYAAVASQMYGILQFQHAKGWR